MFAFVIGQFPLFGVAFVRRGIVSLELRYGKGSSLTPLPKLHKGHISYSTFVAVKVAVKVAWIMPLSCVVLLLEIPNEIG